MLVVTLVLGLWIGWQEAPREVGRWHFAAAVEHRVNAEYLRILGRTEQAQRQAELAQQQVGRALNWNPDDGRVYLQRAQWRVADSQSSEALADCDAAQRLGVPEPAVAQVKMVALATLGRKSEAVREALKVHAHAEQTWTPNDDAMALNGVAYFRSLAREDLPKALGEIETALARLPANARNAGMLDTRGFILYEMGRYEEAQADFQVAVSIADREVAFLRQHPGQLSRPVLDYREFKIEEQSALKNLAVIYYHSSLVLEKLNRWKEAQQHRRKAKELLGREPDASVF